MVRNPSYVNRLLADFVSLDGGPRDVEVHSEKGLLAPCTIQYIHTAPINKIEVYEFHWSTGEEQDSESVIYDKAIHFHLENAKSFCIACQLNGLALPQRCISRMMTTTFGHFWKALDCVSASLHSKRYRVFIRKLCQLRRWSTLHPLPSIYPTSPTSTQPPITPRLIA